MVLFFELYNRFGSWCRPTTVNGVLPRTAKLWATQNKHGEDRLRLFSAVAKTTAATTVLYPGSYVDVAASHVFPDVIYADMDRRAAQFFSDAEGVEAIVAADQVDGRPRRIRFLAGDYREQLAVPDGSVDLLVSLYAGFVSEHRTRYLRPGGWLLVNPSHGDAAMASIDPRYQLVGVVKSSRGDYRVDVNGLDGYLIPKKQQVITPDLLHELNRGVAYTKSPFAYLFQLVENN